MSPTTRESSGRSEGWLGAGTALHSQLSDILADLREPMALAIVDLSISHSRESRPASANRSNMISGPRAGGLGASPASVALAKKRETCGLRSPISQTRPAARWRSVMNALRIGVPGTRSLIVPKQRPIGGLHERKWPAVDRADCRPRASSPWHTAPVEARNSSRRQFDVVAEVRQLASESTGSATQSDRLAGRRSMGARAEKDLPPHDRSGIWRSRRNASKPVRHQMSRRPIETAMPHRPEDRREPRHLVFQFTTRETSQESAIGFGATHIRRRASDWPAAIVRGASYKPYILGGTCCAQPAIPQVPFQARNADRRLTKSRAVFGTATVPHQNNTGDSPPPPPIPRRHPRSLYSWTGSKSSSGMEMMNPCIGRHVCQRSGQGHRFTFSGVAVAGGPM
jgi:hypothetical protein